MKKGIDANLLNVHRIIEKFHGKAAKDEIFKNRGNDDLAYGGFEEPLPDIVGYTQHSSECASDAIQEILMFADVLREFTQPILYNITKPQIDIRCKLTLQYTDWDRFNGYFKYVQKRFRSHYDVINYLRTHKIKPQKYKSDYYEVCHLNPIFYRKRAHSAEAGILALKKLKRERTYTGTGFPLDEIADTVKTILKWLQVPFKVVKSSEINDTDTVGVIINMRTGFIKPDYSVYWKMSMSHETALIKMKGKWFYYDNNEGFVLVEDELAFELLDPAVDIYIVNFKKSYFVKGGLKPTHIWKDGHWDTNVSDVANSDGDGGMRYKVNANIMKINFTEIHGINITDMTLPYNHIRCEFTDGLAESSELAVATMKSIIECIKTNTDSNSAIFEDLYHYMFENIDHLPSDPELYTSLVSTLDTILLRPACTPMIHYWVFKIKTKIKGTPLDVHEWFEVPELKRIEVQAQGRETPPAEREAIRKAEIERLAKKALLEKGVDPDKVEKIPCPPGQVRNAKTKNCREKKKRKSPSSSKKVTPKKREKLSPCPPGQKRDPKTKKCKARVAKLSPCPPGQKRDAKTKKCVDLKKFQLHE